MAMKASFNKFLRRGGDAGLAAIAVAFCGLYFKWETAVWENAILFLAVVVAALSLHAVRRTARQKALSIF